ncbi:uncharacterized protein (DUF302 family) [Roseiarcus fermentans]|uniref:Uncharacterized protein (DUF302 family) n=1 Tax=Roseiarcus fermentans TaxID=1473586 RepID=A0A366FBJ5_9HYPH|nr:DUF302 domain-containing protein [Roseiarcus fermentans]RBP11977.1 uncharacterized protein (DUF302 family) [Roseiarcus fermentans]
MSDLEAPDIVEHTSPLPFDATVERLVEAIAHSGMTIFARIDHAENARGVGLTMPPATVLIYGAAKGGTPIMLATPLAALDLPLRALVREREDGKASIAFHPIAAMLRGAGVPEEAAARLAPAQRMLIAALAP